MDERTANDLSQKLKAFPENIVREEYEMIFLKVLLESQWGKKLIFKGGTALRLAYQSLRFSEDLDFALTGQINWTALKKVLQREVASLTTVKIKELTEKHYTYFSLFSIKESFLPQPFLLKIEISKRPVKWKKGNDFRLTQLTSNVTSLKTTGFVSTKKRVFLDKKKAFRERVKARDVYDLWWLAQEFGKKPFLINGRFNKKAVVSELKRFLPKGSWWVIEEILKRQ